jgi:hypothetical protein
MEKKGGFLKSFTVYFIALFAGLGTLWALGIIPKLVWALIGLAVISCLSAVILAMVKPLGGKGGDAEDTEAGKTSPPPPHEAAIKENLENLVRLNLRARENGLDQDLLTVLEGLVDGLFDILPRLNMEHRGSELAYAVNKISGEYLGQVTGSFLSLSSTARSGQREELLRVLTGLDKEIAEIRGIVDSQATGEFKTHAKFISTKFFGETVEA